LSRILITGHHTYTYGDNAALNCLIGALRKLSPTAMVTVLTDDPEATPIPDGVQKRRWLIDSRKFKDIIFRSREARGLKGLLAVKARLLWWYLNCFLRTVVTSLAWAILKRRGIGWCPCLSAANREIMEEFAAADIVLRCPGGSFTDNYGWWGIWQDCLDMFLPRLLGKPAMLCAPSVGPLDSIHRFVARYVLNRVDLITLREEFSSVELVRMGVTEPAVGTTGDFVTLLQPAPEARIDEIMAAEGLDGKKPLVSITVIDWHFPGLADGEARRARYMRTMAGIADYLAEKWQASILFIPMSYGLARETRFIEELTGLMQYPESARILPEGYSVRELQGIFRRTDFHVGSRVHSVALNAKERVPGIAIAYETKIRGFARMVGMEQYVIDIDALEYEQAVEKIDEAWQNRDSISKHLAEVFGDIEKRAFLNAELVMELLRLSKDESADTRAALLTAINSGARP